MVPDPHVAFAVGTCHSGLQSRLAVFFKKIYIMADLNVAKPFRQVAFVLEYTFMWSWSREHSVVY